MNLNTYHFEGERAATHDHAPILRHLILKEGVKNLKVGAVLVENNGTFELLTASDSTTNMLAIVDKPQEAENTALCLVHGTVRNNCLLVGNTAPTEAILTRLMQNGIYAI